MTNEEFFELLAIIEQMNLPMKQVHANFEFSIGEVYHIEFIGEDIYRKFYTGDYTDEDEPMFEAILNWLEELQ